MGGDPPRHLLIERLGRRDEEDILPPISEASTCAKLLLPLRAPPVIKVSRPMVFGPQALPSARPRSAGEANSSVGQ